VKIAKKKLCPQDTIPATEAITERGTQKDAPPTEDTIRADIESYLAPVLKKYRETLRAYSGSKIVRDVIWGFNVYEPHELAIIDSPPFQRLRNICQTSLALFTYPCSVHSRFEHSLGAAKVASRMLDAIRDRTALSDRTLEIETRLAALLHDLGHGPFSHSSERYYERLAAPGVGRIFDCLKEQNRMFADSSASEIITYLMLTTRSFGDLWEQIKEMYKSRVAGLVPVDLHRVASMILGVDEKVSGDSRFYRQIVNGPFDADKLDYLPRDGYFTGLGIVVDIERLLHTITVAKSPTGERDIAVVASGASVLEEVLFAKTQLYSSVYHHHKVRAAHQLLMQLLRLMESRGYKPAGRSLADPASYLAMDDYDFLHAVPGDPDLDSLISRIKGRVLPMRALVISYPCFAPKDKESRENFDKLFDPENEDLARQVEAQLLSELRFKEGEVIVDLPDLPRLGATGQAIIKLGTNDEDNVQLQKIYPAGAWAKAYFGYRKVAYVFTTAADRRKVALAAKDALARLKYPLKLNNKSLAFAKL
jgi:HD superfamily phosphohydrolase